MQTLAFASVSKFVFKRKEENLTQAGKHAFSHVAEIIFLLLTGVGKGCSIFHFSLQSKFSPDPKNPIKFIESHSQWDVRPSKIEGRCDCPILRKAVASFATMEGHGLLLSFSNRPQVLQKQSMPYDGFQSSCWKSH